jgi:DNA-directed RNA polymerase sigma subunit (sigma70/sigma32)
MPSKVPALPRGAIGRALCTTGVPAQDIRALLRSDDWGALESRNQQVAFFRDFVKNEGYQTLPSDVISHSFGIEASHVRKICSKANKKPKPPHRPPTLDEDQIASVLALV